MNTPQLMVIIRVEHVKRKEKNLEDIFIGAWQGLLGQIPQNTFSNIKLIPLANNENSIEHIIRCIRRACYVKSQKNTFFQY